MNYWFTSDPHFSHSYVAGLRGFSSVAEMNEALCDRWAETVGYNDLVYVLGDVTFKPAKDLPIIAKLPGRKRLIAGNHDTVTAEYHKVFSRVRGGQRFGDELWLTHIPVHPHSIRGIINVHGHMHDKLVKDSRGFIDPRYFNVCVEHHHLRPVHLDTIMAYVAEYVEAQQGDTK